MLIDTSLIEREEGIALELRGLYEQYGFIKYTMRKFEEYSLYLENKNFLPSEFLITFTDRSGKLLALKPDITLSIVKNSKATKGSSEKLWYRESVYRDDKQTAEFKEINQIGVEVIGSIDALQTAEIIKLGAASLAAVDSDYILNLSHMGWISGMLDGLGVDSERLQQEFLAAVNGKRAHDLKRLAAENGIDPQYIARFAEEVLFGSDPLTAAAELTLNFQMERALAELNLAKSLAEAEGFADKLRFEFSFESSTDYYTGIVMQGFVKKLPLPILSGGRYDKLLGKFDRDIGAIGFALYLGRLYAYYAEREFDIDVLLLYGEQTDYRKVLIKASELRKSGARVRVEREAPSGLRFKEIINYD